MRDRAHLDGSELATPIVDRDGPELATEDLPIIDEIDDIKNGVLLSKTLHAGLGKGEIAFLEV